MNVMKDMGLVKESEPFRRLLCQGMIIKDGAKMSKSKGNIVDPLAIINKYGADVLRLFILFAAPPEVDLEWSDEGIEGAHRFLNRVWRFVKQCKMSKRSKETEDKKMQRKIHQTIKKVTEDIEKFRFNTAIAGIMELLNAAGQSPAKEVLEIIVLLLAPFVPHFCEECWSLLGNKPSIFNHRWPSYNPELIKEKDVLIVIQVDGRLRDKLSIPSGTEEEVVKELVLAREKVQRWLQNRKIEKVIFLPDRLVNIVTSS